MPFFGQIPNFVFNNLIFVFGQLYSDLFCRGNYFIVIKPDIRSIPKPIELSHFARNIAATFGKAFLHDLFLFL